MSSSMEVKALFDKDTSTITYVVSDTKTQACAVIDSVLDLDVPSGRTTTKSADMVIAYIKEKQLKVEWLLSTHIHADHITADSYLQSKLGGKTAMASTVKKVLAYWVPVFNTGLDTPLDGSQFDHLFEDGERFMVGSLEFQVMFTPGHTPACATYVVGDAMFVGDTVFMPQLGTARCDFPGGSARQLYQSIRKILSLPDATRIFHCHDYPAADQTAKWESTVGEQKKTNKMINETVSEDQYVEMRQKRDATLAVPRLLYPSLQFNLRNGNLGRPESNGVQYIRIPLNKI